MTSDQSLSPATRAERNKQAVLEFYELLFNQCNPREAVERFAGARYTQHNPDVADGKRAIIDHFERLAAEYPGKRVNVRRAVAEGDLVVLHCHQTWPGDADYAVVNIFGCDEDGRIVEHWDVLQPIPQESANDNPMV